MLFRKAGAACLLGGVFVFASLSAQAEVFINEIHYDNAGSDVGEAIEVVATAGEDLTQYSIKLYNGSDSSNYDTDTLPAGSLVTCGSTVKIAVLNYATNGIQNGNPDALALVGPGGTLVNGQFLSYGGQFSVAAAPINGVTSTNIGVAEASSGAAGLSLQLGGTGSGYSTFAWNTSATSTFGACNNNQTFDLGPQVNVLPSVISTNPANGSTFEIDPPLHRSLTVTFNEPVALDDAGGPYSISCSLSANLMALPTSGRDDPPASVHTIDVRPNSLGTPQFQVGDQCVLTIRANNFTDSDGAHPAADTMVNFSVVLAPNAVPRVVSTTPANNATAFSGSSNFTVNFSEIVQSGTGAFTLQCSVTGAVALSFPSSENVYTLTKNINLQNGETCVLTVVASAISDFANFHLAQNTIVNFTVGEPPNQAPTVFSTTPSNNAVGVPSATDIRVVFNENVSADRESFVLQCSASGLIPLSFNNKRYEMVSGAGRALTLSTYTALQAGETCTLTVIAAGIADDDDLAMAQNYVGHFTIAGGSTEAYYNRVNASSSEQLRCSLNTVIRGHTVYPYSASTTDTWDILEIADEFSATQILDVYKNRLYNKGSDRAGTGSGTTYNREHTWPNSLGFGSDTGNLGLPHGPYTDTHMLYLSDTQYNSDRGNDPYGNCTMASGCSERATEINNGSGGGTGVYPGNSNWTNGSRFQTWGKRKGDVARAVMYMAIRYEGGTHTVTGQNEPDLELTDSVGLIGSTSSSPAYMGLLTDLLQWHQADPPDAAELARNQVIFSYQGNRNPFIDHPEWGTAALFTSAKPASCTLNAPPPMLRRKR